MKSIRKEWIEILEHRYKQHQSETLDHKDCKEIAELLKEKQTVYNTERKWKCQICHKYNNQYKKICSKCGNSMDLIETKLRDDSLEEK